MKKILWGALIACAISATALAPALAAPGAGNEVYGATVEAHEIELETRYGVLTGGPDKGADNFRLEAGYGVNSHLKLAVVGEFEKEPGGTRKATHLGFEAVAPLGKLAGINVAAYAEYELGLNGTSNSVEAKLLLQKRPGPWDARFNLIGEKPLQSGQPLQLSYAASVDRSVAKFLRLGITGFGELGTFSHFLPTAEHYIGPELKFRIPLGDRDGDGDEDRGIWIQPSFLFPLGAARESSTGQFRLNLEFGL